MAWTAQQLVGRLVACQWGLPHTLLRLLRRYRRLRYYLLGHLPNQRMLLYRELRGLVVWQVHTIVWA